MNIAVRHNPQEHWGFRTPLGMVWVSAWGSGPVELDRYHIRRGYYGLAANHQSYRTLREMFGYAQYKEL